MIGTYNRLSQEVVVIDNVNGFQRCLTNMARRANVLTELSMGNAFFIDHSYIELLFVFFHRLLLVLRFCFPIVGLCCVVLSPPWLEFPVFLDMLSRKSADLS